MRKSAILIITSVILMGCISSAYAGEILGYPLVAKQAKFYMIILGVIGASVTMVAVAYLIFWLADWKNKAVLNKKAAFARELAAAVQPAK